MQLATMYLKRAGSIGYLTLNRPRLLNAMNYQGVLDLHGAAERIRDDPHIRLVLLQRAGVLHRHRPEATRRRRDATRVL